MPDFDWEEREWRALLAYARRVGRCADPSVTHEDVVQEAYRRLYSAGRQNLRPEGRLSYLRVVVRSIMVDLSRRGHVKFRAATDQRAGGQHRSERQEETYDLLGALSCDPLAGALDRLEAAETLRALEAAEPVAYTRVVRGVTTGGIPKTTMSRGRKKLREAQRRVS